MTPVLLVDDSPLMRRYVARTLEMTGMDLHIYEAGNGKEALRCAIEIRPRVIITDLNMPEMSGQELVDRVRESPELDKTAVLVLSADRSTARLQQLTSAGAVAYLIKPVTPEDLRQALLDILEVRS